MRRRSVKRRLIEPVRQIRGLLGHIMDQAELLDKLQRDLPAMRQRAYDAGVPGSNEEINTPLVEISEACYTAIDRIRGINATVQLLLSKEPEEWR